MKRYITVILISVILLILVVVVVKRSKRIRYLNDRMEELDYKANVVNYSSLESYATGGEYPVGFDIVYSWYYRNLKSPKNRFEVVSSPLHDVYECNEFLEYQPIYINREVRDFMIYSRGPDGSDDTRKAIRRFNQEEDEILDLNRMRSPLEKLGLLDFGHFDVMLRPPYQLIEEGKVKFRDDFKWAGINQKSQMNEVTVQRDFTLTTDHSLCDDSLSTAMMEYLNLPCFCANSDISRFIRIIMLVPYGGTPIAFTIIPDPPSYVLSVNDYTGLNFNWENFRGKKKNEWWCPTAENREWIVDDEKVNELFNKADEINYYAKSYSKTDRLKSALNHSLILLVEFKNRGRYKRLARSIDEDTQITQLTRTLVSLVPKSDNVNYEKYFAR